MMLKLKNKLEMFLFVKHKPPWEKHLHRQLRPLRYPSLFSLTANFRSKPRQHPPQFSGFTAEATDEWSCWETYKIVLQTGLFNKLKIPVY